MDDYISRADAIQALVSITAYNSVEEIRAACFDSYARANGWLGGVMESIAALAEGVPAADVRPAVLCRDCENAKHWYSDKFLCYLWSESGIDVFADGFCSYGKRRGADMGGSEDGT